MKHKKKHKGHKHMAPHHTHGDHANAMGDENDYHHGKHDHKSHKEPHHEYHDGADTEHRSGHDVSGYTD